MENIVSTILFAALSGALLISAFLVISLQNPVRSALSLVVCFFAAAGLWILLSAEFLGLILILVYVGAVMTLFLFVVMTLQTDDADNTNVDKNKLKPYLPVILIVLITGLLSVLFIYVLKRSFSGFLLPVNSLISSQQAQPNINLLGNVLYTQYVLPFEMTAVILLAAMIAAISLSLRNAACQKRQNISAQIKIRKQDRVRLVK